MASDGSPDPGPSTLPLMIIQTTGIKTDPGYDMVFGYREAHIYAQVGFGLRYITLFGWCHGDHSEPFKIPETVSPGHL